VLNQVLINSIVLTCLSAALTWFATRYWVNKAALVREADKLAAAHQKLEDTVTELTNQLGLVKQAVVPISTAFQAILVQKLTHFHTPEMDALMVKLGPPSTLTFEEEERLAVMLREREKEVDPQISPEEKDAAHMLPMVMRMVKYEQEKLAEAPVQLKLVTVVPAKENGENNQGGK